VDGHIVVFGCHGVARRVIRHLVQAGREVLVIDREATRQDREDLLRWGATYVESSDHRQYTLGAADLDNAAAVLCIDEDDLRNVEMALLVREMSPAVRIVVYTSNSSVNRALEPIARPGTVLDVAALSSRSIVEAVVEAHTRVLDLDGEPFTIVTVPAEDGDLRTQWGSLAPLAVERADGSPLIVGPGRNLQVSRGDMVTLIGRESDFAAQGIDGSPPQVQRHRRSPLNSIRAGFKAVSDAVDRPFRIAFGILTLLGLVSVVLLLIGYREPDGSRMDPLDAVYFTAETIGQVGFGDFYFRDQSTWLRLWSVFLILFGILLVAVVTALLTNTLVTRRLEQSLGRQRLTGLRDHIVIVGLGSVGLAVATELRASGYEVAVVDRDENNRYVPQARDAGISVLFGDATLHETLVNAGIEQARGAAVLTSDDMVNIEVGLAIRDAVGDRHIPVALRVFERDLGRVLGRDLALGTTRSTAELAAPWFVGAALGLSIVSTFYVGGTALLAARITVRPGSGLDGLAMRDIDAKTRVIAIRRADSTGPLEHPPRRDTLLHAGDRAYLVGQYEELLDLLQRAGS